MHLCRIRGAD